MSQNKTILSGIQPTGKLHFGRYFGAVENWIRLQQDYNCYFMVANYHAMSMPFTAKKMAEQSWDVCFNQCLSLRDQNDSTFQTPSLFLPSSASSPKLDVKNREANLGEVELPIQDATFASHATLTILFGIIFCLGCLLRTTGAPCGRGTKYPHCSSCEREIYPTPVKECKIKSAQSLL